MNALSNSGDALFSFILRPFQSFPCDLGSSSTSQSPLITAMGASFCRQYSGPLVAAAQMWQTHTSCCLYFTEWTDHTQTQLPKAHKWNAPVNLRGSSFLQSERGTADFCFCTETYYMVIYFKGRSGQMSVDNKSRGIYFKMYPAWG